NQFGTDEFMRFCRAVAAEPMLAVNLGTGTAEEAAQLVEYCNAPAGTHYADWRVANGHREPYGVRYWCLGNEMDGPWQIGALDAHAYGLKALEAAKLMRLQDPQAKLVLCGSSHPRMPTFPEWDRIALETCWEKVDYHAMHCYAENFSGDSASFLGYGVQFEEQLRTVAATLQFVKAKRRSKHDVFLSWDEWNVWYKDTSGDGGWQEAPRLSEEVYNLEDALVVAQWLSVFLRNADVLRIACLAQIVNTISPITTTPTGLLKHSTYYPLVLFSRNARGLALAPLVKSPTYHCERFGEVPLLDASASLDEAAGKGAVFLVNRSLTDGLAVDVVWQGRQPRSVEAVWQLSGTDPKASNSLERPQAVAPRAVTPPSLEGNRASLTLPPLSFTTLLLSY
ncbi:MAG TPA: alpha-L-arabinofuranosidase C-terminal domain-containing protein, partial [Deinococcales bacterium]|nr:alpha-L-arabinofuranosidase C-terminal domain-containing protein [Deinococcales bacterium]